MGSFVKDDLSPALREPCRKETDTLTGAVILQALSSPGALQRSQELMSGPNPGSRVIHLRVFLPYAGRKICPANVSFFRPWQGDTGIFLCQCPGDVSPLSWKRYAIRRDLRQDIVAEMVTWDGVFSTQCVGCIVSAGRESTIFLRSVHGRACSDACTDRSQWTEETRDIRTLSANAGGCQ